ncbi:hypothetical protein ACJIZ3_020019 [Penstemon smallii]|uniref:Uncharacterized protein n=1 Tax=Penstemon smallii TaxID=265156 RepID=A0ABD3SI11_9LAMI
MRNRLIDRFYFCSTQYTSLRKFSSSSTLINYKRKFPTPTPRNPCLFDTFKTTRHSLKPTSSFSYFTVFRFLSSASSSITDETRQCPIADDSNEEVEPIDSWEEEDEVDPVIGDGGDGGGVVLQNCPWGERTLSIAHQVLQPFGNDLELFAFKTSHRGYIYVRLDKLSNE